MRTMDSRTAVGLMILRRTLEFIQWTHCPLSIVNCQLNSYRLALELIILPKNNELANNLLVPYQNALKLTSSAKLMTRPEPIEATWTALPLAIIFPLSG